MGLTSFIGLAVLLLSSSLTANSSPVLGYGAQSSGLTSQEPQLDATTSQLEKRAIWQDIKSAFVNPTIYPTVEKFRAKERLYKDHQLAAAHAYLPQELIVPGNLKDAQDPSKYIQGKYFDQGPHFGRKMEGNMRKKTIVEEEDLGAIVQEIKHNRGKATEAAGEARSEKNRAKAAEKWRKIWKSEAAGKEGVVRNGFFGKAVRPPNQHAKDTYAANAQHLTNNIIFNTPEYVHGYRETRKVAENQEFNLLKATALATRSKTDAREVARKYLQNKVAHEDRAKELLERSKHYNAKKRGWKSLHRKVEKAKRYERGIPVLGPV